MLRFSVAVPFFLFWSKHVWFSLIPLFPWGVVRALVSFLVFVVYFSDYIITWYNVSNGLALEGNPVVASLLSDPMRYWFMAFMVSLVTSLLVYACFVLKKTYGWVAAFIVLAVKGFVVSWNLRYVFSLS